MTSVTLVLLGSEWLHAGVWQPVGRGRTDVALHARPAGRRGKDARPRRAPSGVVVRPLLPPHALALPRDDRALVARGRPSAARLQAHHRRRHPERRPRPGQPAGGAVARARRGPGRARGRPALVLGADRRGPDLRPAVGAVRPRAAHAARLLHPHPDRRAHQPHEQRRRRRPAGAHRHPRPARVQRDGPRLHARRHARARVAPHAAGAGRPARSSSSRPSASAAGCRRITREAHGRSTPR